MQRRDASLFELRRAVKRRNYGARRDLHRPERRRFISKCGDLVKRNGSGVIVGHGPGV